VSLRHGGDAKSVNQMKKNENIIIKKKKKKETAQIYICGRAELCRTGTTG